jgi:hypothetical protein
MVDHATSTIAAAGDAARYDETPAPLAIDNETSQHYTVATCAGAGPG